MLIIMFYMLQIGFRKVSLIDCALSFEMCVRSLALANNKTTETNVEGEKNGVRRQRNGKKCAYSYLFSVSQQCGSVKETKKNQRDPLERCVNNL